jgi:hypothetical protein
VRGAEITSQVYWDIMPPSDRAELLSVKDEYITGVYNPAGFPGKIWKQGHFPGRFPYSARDLLRRKPVAEVSNYAATRGRLAWWRIL